MNATDTKWNRHGTGGRYEKAPQCDFCNKREREQRSRAAVPVPVPYLPETTVSVAGGV